MKINFGNTQYYGPFSHILSHNVMGNTLGGIFISHNIM